MVYPRRCPLCGAGYDTGRVERADHVTLQAEPGGTHSPWRPDEPGRLLTLGCLICKGEYAWDYFGGRLPPGEVLSPRPRLRAAPRRSLPVLPGFERSVVEVSQWLNSARVISRSGRGSG